MNFGLTRLNAMIGQWNRRRWLVYHLMDVTCQTTGSLLYTVGPGGNFNIPAGRPDKLEDGCFFRQYVSPGSVPGPIDFNQDFNSDFASIYAANQGVVIGFPVDYPLTLLEAREDYNKIALKNMGSWPSFVYYDAAMTLRTPIGQLTTDPQFPCGNLFINPVPAAGQFEIHILVKDVLSAPANLSTVLLTPPEYEEAFEYNLALRFCAKYQIPATPEISGLARAALSTIRSANTQVPQLSLPAPLTGSGRHYNVYNDRSN